MTLKQLGVEVLLVSPPGDYRERFASLGLRWRPLPFTRRSLNPIDQARAVAGLARIYANERPDVVHHFTIKSAVYGSIAARLTRVPTIVNSIAGLGSAAGQTSLSEHGLARRLAFASLRLALRNTHVIVQNPDDGEFLIRQRIVEAARCQLIKGSGVDLARFRPTRKRTLGVTVLLASRLLWSKGIKEFVEAAIKVRSRHPQVRFVIAGDADPGNPDTLLPADLDELSRNSNIVMRGHVDDMPSLLAETDIVALPTSYGEGVPRILVEAAACGLPLITTDAPGCREIVRPGVNGYLIKARDVGALAEAIDRLASNHSLRGAMGVQSRLFAETEFGEAIVLDATIRTYGVDPSSSPRTAAAS
jgi:glycosyltransferase involved in cell wall biosynthesis